MLRVFPGSDASLRFGGAFSGTEGLLGSGVCFWFLSEVFSLQDLVLLA